MKKLIVCLVLLVVFMLDCHGSSEPPAASLADLSVEPDEFDYVFIDRRHKDGPYLAACYSGTMEIWSGEIDYYEMGSDGSLDLSISGQKVVTVYGPNCVIAPKGEGK